MDIPDRCEKIVRQAVTDFVNQENYRIIERADQNIKGYYGENHYSVKYLAWKPRFGNKKIWLDISRGEKNNSPNINGSAEVFENYGTENENVVKLIKYDYDIDGRKWEKIEEIDTSGLDLKQFGHE